MPNIGFLELIAIFLWLVISIAVGYWCMTVFRRKGKPGGGGFALGFFLTLLLPLLGAAIAVAISYGQRSSLPGRCVPPRQPTPEATEQDRINEATFLAYITRPGPPSK